MNHLRIDRFNNSHKQKLNNKYTGYTAMALSSFKLQLDYNDNNFFIGCRINRYLTMMEKFTVMITEMPAKILLVTEGAVAFAAFKRAIFVVNDFDVTFEVTAASEPCITKVTSVRPLMSVSLQMSLE